MGTINYNNLVNHALRNVVRSAISVVVKDTSYSNCLYISFLTKHNDVVIPDFLKKKYDKEMTIVIEHQYWDLKIEEDHFSVTLSFNDKPVNLIIAFAAITKFSDRINGFNLTFDEAIINKEASDDDIKTLNRSEKILHLDQFRKN